ncbi:hypothetical protein GCM10015536_21430 [Streptomyces griseomycini]|nr:hypothetical protein GCM10015536_21430 [Streptomyces griseomycini]
MAPRNRPCAVRGPPFTLLPLLPVLPVGASPRAGGGPVPLHGAAAARWGTAAARQGADFTLSTHMPPITEFR